MDALPARAAVVVVGGGFAGAATAWWLTRHGVTDVVVIEREARLGRHASGRNAGMCRQVAEDDDWTARCVRGATFLREPPSGFASRPLVEVTGSLLLADDDATLDGLAARARRHGVSHRTLGSAAVLELAPWAAGLRCAGALHTLDDGIIDTVALLDGFALGARGLGARIVTSCDVLAARDGELVTTRGAIRGDQIVCAAGAWAGVLGALAGAGAHGFAAMKRHISFLATAADGPARGAPFVWRVGADEVYVRHGADGLMASGCDAAATAPGDVAIDAAADLLAARLASAPRLAALEVTGTWACQRTFAPEGQPRLGRDPVVPWLWWAAGLGGHGATCASAIGEDAAAAISASGRS